MLLPVKNRTRFGILIGPNSLSAFVQAQCLQLNFNPGQDCVPAVKISRRLKQDVDRFTRQIRIQTKQPRQATTHASFIKSRHDTDFMTVVPTFESL
jgi:hypothetical protein